MRTSHVKKTVAMSGAMFIALMGATSSADALAPHQGQDHHATTDQVKKSESDKSHAKADHAKTNQGKKADHQSQGQHSSSHASTSSHGSSSPAVSGTHGHTGAAASGKGGDPAGNNGTVKIAPLGDFDGIPNNTPHVGCDFLVEWYGFDEGADIISTVTFAMQAPTSDVVLGGYTPTTVFVGEDPASGAGTDTGLDARQEYHLTFDVAPHPKQGYHVKLTINTPHSKGADVKHKVFWVQGCEDTTAGGETPVGETPGGETGTTPEVEGEQAHSSHSGGSSAPEVLGVQAEVKGQQAAANKAAQAAVPTAVNSGLVPVTTAVNAATDEWPLALGALGLSLLGAGALTRRARR